MDLLYSFSPDEQSSTCNLFQTTTTIHYKVSKLTESSSVVHWSTICTIRSSNEHSDFFTNELSISLILFLSSLRHIVPLFCNWMRQTKPKYFHAITLPLWSLKVSLLLVFSLSKILGWTSFLILLGTKIFCLWLIILTAVD